MRSVVPFLRRHLAQERLLGGALVLSITQFLASLAGFFRDQSLTIVFPPDSDPIGVASIYIASFRPSDLLFQVFVMSSLSTVLVPFLAKHLTDNNRTRMNELTSSILVVTSVLFGAIALILAWQFPSIAHFFVAYQGETFHLYVVFGRFALLTNALFILGNALGQYLIAIQKYYWYGITPILWALGTIAGTYLLTPLIGPLGPMVGTLIGTVCYVVLRLAAALHAGYTFTLPRGRIIDPDLSSMGLLIIPRMVALGALQAEFLLFDRIGSSLSLSAVSLSGFARNFQSVAIGVVGIALAQSAFSPLSQAVARKHLQSFIVYLRKGIVWNVLLTTIAAAGLIVLADIPAWLLRLQGSAKETFAILLMIYALSIPFESITHLLLRSFYALKDTTTPAITTLLAASAAVTTAYVLVPSYDIFAIPIGYGVGQLTQTLLLCALPISRGYRLLKKSSS